jgi:hypothetical protein
MIVERKLDIFKVLKELDNKNSKFFDSLTDDEQKSLQPLIVMRWLSGTTSKQQVMLINELLNKYIFSFSKHKKILWDIMTICTAGRHQNYSWIKKQAGGSSYPISVKVIQQYFNYNTKTAIDTLPLLNHSDMLDMADEMGWQDDDLNKLRKELGLSTIRKPRVGAKQVIDNRLDDVEL